MATLEINILKYFLIIIAFHVKIYNTEQVGECGKDLVGNSGSFTSPKYPENYPTNQECTWNLSVDEKQKIKLNFSELRLEDSALCLKDYILIYDGPSKNSPLIARTCTRSNHVFISSSNTMTVYFKSDKLTTARGFTADYKNVPLSNFEPSCGGIIASESGSFTSPNYPQMYPYSAECTWYIHVSKGQNILLKFSDIDIEWGADCRFDHVEIYLGPSRNSPLIGLTCTVAENEFLINSNAVTVHFTSDRSVVRRGFSGDFRAITGGTYCGGNLKDNSGIFSSPNYPAHYPNNVECTWHITVDNGEIINLNLGHPRLQTADACTSDYIDIYDGPSKNSKLISRVCQPTDFVFPSSSNYMTVYFRSDSSGSSNGFKASYTTDTKTLS